MGTGISMSSVNKIKELAESRDYSLALDILEHQDLTKSLSPQFIRICGEVYCENKRYAEARAALVKAHSMAPMGNKIIYSLIRVYLAMGFYTLVNTYYDIYNFNRNEKDAGTYRIEYLIAKANRKPYKELYGILISANEIDTNDIWDFEMLVLYAAMQDTERLKNESEIFRATYKGSPYLEAVEHLLDGTFDIEAEVYCYPKEEQEDIAPEQEETRIFEKKTLEDDELRMHPKDPKITLMVDDREPISNSMKFKQMLVKSKEKREEKKLLKQEKKEQQTEQDGQGEQETKEKRFRFGRVSKKDAEAFESTIAEQTEAGVDKEKLLDEIMLNQEHEKEFSEKELLQQQKEQEEEEVQEAVTETAEEQSDKEEDQTEESLFDAEIDNFDIQTEDDYDAVLMVDPEAFEEESESELEAKPEAEPEPEAKPEPEVEPETEILAEEPEPEILVEEPEPGIFVEEPEPEILVEEPEPEPEVIVEELEAADSAEMPETAETAERLGEEQELTLTEEPESSESESSGTEQFDIDVAIQSLDDYAFETEVWENDSFEQAYEKDGIVEIDEEPVEESFEELFDESNEEPDEPELYDESDEEPDEPELYDESEVIENEPKIIEEIKEHTEQRQDEPTDILKKPDFPIFRSSLFPDYHSGEPPVIKTEPETVDIKEEYDAKMSENLKKEEALISEADELLARLGIELGTKYSANTDYFHMHEDDRANDISSESGSTDRLAQNGEAQGRMNRTTYDGIKQAAGKEKEHTEDKKYKLKNNGR